MHFLSFIFKAYVVVLLLRWILTQQELTFNFIGRGIAKITNPLLAHKGKLKSETDRFIPLIIALIALLYGVIAHFAMKLPWGGAITGSFRDMVLFLTLFFVVCVLLGSMASPSTGALPLYFYRLGNIWVKPVRKVLPLRGNKIIIPTLLLIMLVFIGTDLAIKCVNFSLYSLSFNIPKMLAGSAVVLGIGLTKILFGLIIIIIIRALLSWFSPDPRNILVQLVYYITEPVLAPMRRMVPPLGVLDLSALVTIVLLSFLQGGLGMLWSWIITNAGLMTFM